MIGSITKQSLENIGSGLPANPGRIRKPAVQDSVP